MRQVGAAGSQRHHPDLVLDRLLFFSQRDELLLEGEMSPIRRQGRLRNPLADAAVGVLRLVLVGQQARGPVGGGDVQPAQRGRLFRRRLGLQVDEMACRDAPDARRRGERADQSQQQRNTDNQPQQCPYPDAEPGIHASGDRGEDERRRGQGDAPGPDESPRPGGCHRLFSAHPPVNGGGGRGAIPPVNEGRSGGGFQTERGRRLQNGRVAGQGVVRQLEADRADALFDQALAGGTPPTAAGPGFSVTPAVTVIAAVILV